MKEENEVKTTENVGFTAKVEQFWMKYEKTAYICIIAVLVVILAIFGYKKLIAEPHAQEAQEQSFYAYNYFMNGQYDLALKGANNEMGFIAIADEYGHTPAGRTAKYMAGICQLNLGKYQEALDYFESYKGKDTFTKYQCEMLKGDCYYELNQIDKAITYYQKAADSKEDIVAPTALYKLGYAYFAQGQKDKAKEAFETIHKKYPQSPEASAPDTDKMISLIEHM